MPYSNINNAAHDSYVLFPNKKDEDIRNSWVELDMEWELIQGIHRIRPILKSSVDIIIATKYWPQLLSEPQKQIDHSQNKNWKEITIEVLEPFVREFGFLNPDIAYMANVVIKSKVTSAKEFQRKVVDILRANTGDHGNYPASPFYLREGDIWGDSNICFNFLKNNQYFAQSNKSNLILVLYILLYQNLDRTENNLPSRILKCLGIKSKSKVSIPITILSNTNQWTELLIYFKNKYPHFEEFKIKLPHAKGHYVHGIGSKSEVIDFYQQINSYEIFGKIDLDSYCTKNTAEKIIDPISIRTIVHPDDWSAGTFLATFV